jgi:hypothetical protein
MICARMEEASTIWDDDRKVGIIGIIGHVMLHIQSARFLSHVQQEFESESNDPLWIFSNSWTPKGSDHAIALSPSSASSSSA